MIGILLLILIFIIIIVINQYIVDNNYRLIFFFVIGLAVLTIMNLYISIVYYIKLRNEKGKRGPRGEKGDKGPKGHQGKCSISRKCGIIGCDEKIYSIARELYPKLSKSCLKNPDKCENEAHKEQAIPINKQLKLLISECKTTKRNEDDFMKRIRPQLG